MRVLLTAVAFLATAGTGMAATACPALTLGFSGYSAVPGSKLQYDATNCNLRTRDTLQRHCICPNSIADLTQKGSTVPYDCHLEPQFQQSTVFAPHTTFSTIPQILGPNGRCVPEWNLAQPPINDLSVRRARAIEASQPVAPRAVRPVQTISRPVAPRAIPPVHFAPPPIHFAPPPPPAIHH